MIYFNNKKFVSYSIFNNKIANINNLNNNNSIINIFYNKDSTCNNNALNNNENNYNISKNTKEKFENNVTDDGLFSNHIYFTYNDFKPYSADDLRKLFNTKSKMTKTLKEFVNKFYFLILISSSLLHHKNYLQKTDSYYMIFVYKCQKEIQ